MERKKIRIHDLDLLVCTYNSTLSSCPIIILHGFLDHHLAWDTLAKKLTQQGHSVLSYDQRGHGKSSHVSLSSQYHFPDYISDLYELLKTYNITKCHIIGHSMGGTVASIFAAVFPECVEKLILIEGLGPSHETEIQSFSRLKQHFHQRTKTPTHKIYSSLSEMCLRVQKIHPYLNEEQVLTYTKYLSIEIKNTDQHQGWTWSYDPRHKDAAAISFHAKRHLQVLQKIKSPTYLCFGEQSWYIRLLDLQQRIQKLNNCVDIQNLNCGHNPHLECPAELSNWLFKNVL